MRMLGRKPNPFHHEDLAYAECFGEEPFFIEMQVNQARADWEAAYARLSVWQQFLVFLGFDVHYPEKPVI